MKSLFKSVAFVACLFGVFSAAAQAADDHPAVPYYRSASMTAQGGAQTWTAKIFGGQSSSRAIEVQGSLAQHLQMMTRKDLLIGASVTKAAEEGTFDVKIELAETAVPVLFAKEIGKFVIKESCDYNTTIVIDCSPEFAAKLMQKDSVERKVLDVKLIGFTQWAHWLPLQDVKRSEVAVEIIAQSKTSITFDVMLDPAFVKQQQKAIQLSMKAKQVATKNLGI